jgi:hypothetical protein
MKGHRSANVKLSKCGKVENVTSLLTLPRSQPHFTTSHPFFWGVTKMMTENPAFLQALTNKQGGQLGVSEILGVGVKVLRKPVALN